MGVIGHPAHQAFLDLETGDALRVEQAMIALSSPITSGPMPSPARRRVCRMPLLSKPSRA